MADDRDKNVRRKRRRSARSRRRGGIPPIMWLAVVVCLAGAVILFRSDSGYGPTGLGDQTSVITAPDIDSTLSGLDVELGLPRSGDVEIGEQARDIVPEQPTGTSGATAAEKKPATDTNARTATSAQTSPVVTPPTTPPARPTPAAAPVQPQSEGPYVVQVGSFGDATNADREAARLKQLGWTPLVKVGNTSDGTMIYRVRIAYFKSRTEAATFIRQNQKHIPGAIPAHR